MIDWPYGGNDQPDGVLEVGHLLRCSSDGVLGDFLVTTGFLCKKSWFRSIFGVEECQVELSVWPTTS